MAVWESAAGGFSIDLGEGEWTPSVAVDDEQVYAVDFRPEDSAFLLRVQRFRREIPVDDAEQFGAVVDGVLLGIEESLRPMKVLERKTTADAARIRCDLVLRGKRLDIDIIERRRILATGPVPPGALFLLTAASPAERFLVHRREFERLFDSFVAREGGT